MSAQSKSLARFLFSAFIPFISGHCKICRLTTQSHKWVWNTFMHLHNVIKSAPPDSPFSKITEREDNI